MYVLSMYIVQLHASRIFLGWTFDDQISNSAEPNFGTAGSVDSNFLFLTSLLQRRRSSFLSSQDGDEKQTYYLWISPPFVCNCCGLLLLLSFSGLLCTHCFCRRHIQRRHFAKKYLVVSNVHCPYGEARRMRAKRASEFYYYTYSEQSEPPSSIIHTSRPCGGPKWGWERSEYPISNIYTARSGGPSWGCELKLKVRTF